MDFKSLRLLGPDDIELRVGQAYENKCTLLLYKNARVDMNILDEWVGPLNWTRSHEVVNGNLFCTVSIYDDDRGVWISKQDVGTESRQDAEKGQASDSFKRACVNWGIGRELYTAPDVWIDLSPAEIGRGKTGNIIVKTRFHVSDIEYQDRKITRLVVKDSRGIVRFHTGQRVNAPAPEPTQQQPPAQTTKRSAPPKQEPPKQTAPTPAPASGNDMMLTFGKHKGEMLSDVWAKDRQYCEWMLGSDKINNNIKQIIMVYMDRLEEAEEDVQEDLFNPDFTMVDDGDIPF